MSFYITPPTVPLLHSEDGFTRTFIPEFRYEGFLAAVDKLNRRATKLGLPHIEVTLTGKREVRDFATTVVGYEYEKREVQKVEAIEICVIGYSPVLDGWQFVATIDRIEESEVNVLNKRPSYKGVIPQKYRKLSHWCDHCKCERKRKQTFILEHTDGRFAQIGRQCIKDFLGHKDIHSITDSASIFSSFQELLDECEGFEGEGGIRAPKIHDLSKTLVTTFNVIQEEGWVSRQASRDQQKEATADRVADLLGGDKHIRSTKKFTEEEIIAKREALRTGNDESNKFVEECIAWVRSNGVDNGNEYLENLAAVFSVDFVTGKRLGLACSAIKAYQTHLGSLAEAAKTASKTNEHFGTVGERVTLELTVIKLVDCKTAFGISTLCLFEDAQGRAFKWFASNCWISEAAVGQSLKIVASIKAHDEYKGRKQTSLTRCKEWQEPKAKRAKKVTQPETAPEPTEDELDREDERAGFVSGTLANDRRLAEQGLTVVRFPGSNEVLTRNSRGRCIDAPCCGCCTF